MPDPPLPAWIRVDTQKLKTVGGSISKAGGPLQQSSDDLGYSSTILNIDADVDIAEVLSELCGDWAASFQMLATHLSTTGTKLEGSAQVFDAPDQQATYLFSRGPS